MPDKDKAARRSEAARKLAEDVKDSAHKIWLAGLGVFDTTREEGGKLFKKMVKKGRAFEERARPKVEAAVADVGQAVRDEVDQLQERMRGLVQKLEDLRAAAAGAQAAQPASPPKRAARKTPGKRRAAKKKAPSKRAAAPRKATQGKRAGKKAAKRRPARKKAPPTPPAS
jgi:poly(hydroxyalkanoate) granule-associated protein